jgi:hypothetical protein
MSRRNLYLIAVAVLLAGCVPVTEPLSDPDKAEPDKRLLGKWQRVGETQSCEIDAPAVKGHPKGLLRAVYEGKADDPKNAFWFFTTTIGKDTYVNIYLDQHAELKFADFRKEGAFAAWNKAKARRYFIFRYVLDGNNLTVDGGDSVAVADLMKAEKIGGQQFYETPPHWLAKYLEKNGPPALYKGSNVQQWRRPGK